jgi:exopolysaccharide biosynthesis polyprenyl glycosylphosphotransferase
VLRLFHAYIPVRTVLLAVSEAALIVAALLATTMVFLGANGHLVLASQQRIVKIAVASLVCMLCMYYYDLYDSLALGCGREAFLRLIQVLGTACLILAVLYGFYPNLQLDMAILSSGAALVGVLLIGWRMMFLILNRSPRFTERAMILGDGPLAPSVAEEIQKRPELGMRLRGYVSCCPGSRCAMNGLKCLGDEKDLTVVVNQERINRIIVTPRDDLGRMPVADLLELKTHGVRVDEGFDFYEVVTGKVPLDSLQLTTLLSLGDFGVSRGLMIYRLSSRALSALLLVLTLPVLGLIALAIWLDSGFPVFFRQERLGKDGKAFAMYKFRTMQTNADPDGRVRPAQEDDERFTRVGRWLRRTRLDELPQLYNILRGDMHFVGPRPFARDEEERLVKQIPFYSQRWKVKPGATGWAQVHRGYCETLEDNIEKFSYDLFYLKHMSVGLDLVVLFKTVKILLKGRGAR